MLRLASFLLLLFTCVLTQAEEGNGAKTTAIIFSVPSHMSPDGKQQALSEAEKTSTEKMLQRQLSEIGLSSQSMKWNEQGELKLVLPPLGEVVRQDAIRELTQKKLIRYGYLTLNLVHPENRTLTRDLSANPEKDLPSGYILKTLVNTDDHGKTINEAILIKKTPILDNQSIKHAQELHGSYGGNLSIELNEEGTKRISAATKKMRHGSDRLAIILDGEILSAPIVQASLGSKLTIFVSKDAAEAKKIAAALLSPLTNSLKVKSINPPLAK